MAEPDPHPPASIPARLFPLTLGAIGVVYGDIGTSPLYAFRESLSAAGATDAATVLGLLSLIFWTLTIIVTLKYILLLLRADNAGEGGILSLMALVRGHAGRYASRVLLLGMAGAALFYGDAAITPAISVLSALEGLHLATKVMDPYIIPVAIAVMVLLFAVQRHGTTQVARFFGPVMALWCIAMAAGGIIHLRDNPSVWKAVSPLHAFSFLAHHGWAGMIALGAVFLCVTGAEALYADLGHFGKKPIRLAWLGFVFPALLLNYFGQGALVLAHPEAASDPFYLLYPAEALLPMVLLATLATIIASQAVITGAYSLTHQAIRLGMLPFLRIQYTSDVHAGQIYVPQVNWLLLAAVTALIAIFRTSAHLASAYGIAVSGTMVITACLVFLLTRRVWGWGLAASLAVVGPLLAIDLTFFTANLAKVLEGGFIPLLISSMLMTLMYVWVRGRAILRMQTHDRRHTVHALMAQLASHPPIRVPGIAVYLRLDNNYAPTALLQNLKHNHVLHEQNIFITLVLSSRPFVPDAERLRTEKLEGGFLQAWLEFGYMERPNLTKGLSLMREAGFSFDLRTTSFFISRRHIVPSPRFGMRLWQDKLFIAMSNAGDDIVNYFHIPRSRVVEMGVQMTV